MTEDLRLGREIDRENIWKFEAGNETRWWNEDVQESIQRKKLANITLAKDRPLIMKRTKLHIK